MRKIEDIYFIDKNNAPQPHTIIENTSFKQNGYRITHFSMGQILLVLQRDIIILRYIRVILEHCI